MRVGNIASDLHIRTQALASRWPRQTVT
jgi:hypothetical protein